MGAAAVAVRVVHVPQPTASGIVAAVTTPRKPVTLAAALDVADVSQAALALACGVSRPRVSQWADPDHDAEPNLAHVRRMPRAVRRAIGQALVDAADAALVPTDEARWVGVALGLVTRLSGLTARFDAARSAGRDESAGILREINVARDDLARLEAGVRAATGAGK
jgi:hypothetical protein